MVAFLTKLDILMTHIVLPKCINCKYGDCIEVCPVDCFHEGENMVVIDPEVCIDCGVCVQECPVEAIVQQDLKNPIHSRWLTINYEAVHKYNWPQVINKTKPHVEADKYSTIENKEDMFSFKPATKNNND